MSRNVRHEKMLMLNERKTQKKNYKIIEWFSSEFYEKKKWM